MSGNAASGNISSKTNTILIGTSIIFYNAVKHGEVDRPEDWPCSSFHRWAQQGVYEADWGCSQHGPLSFEDLNETAMEYEVHDVWERER